MAQRVVTHSNSGYIRGCRCDICKSANADYRRARYRELMDTLIAEHGGKCIRCGATWPLEFHHRDPSTKVNRIAWFVSHKGIAAILEEAAKCDLLCKDCHDEKHGELAFRR